MNAPPALLLDSDSWIQNIAETTSAGIFVYRERFLYLNPACVELTGYPLEELMALDPARLLPKDRREELTRDLRARLGSSEGSQRAEIPFVRKDGGERWADITGNWVDLGEGPAVVGTVLDVTDRKRAEEALRDSESWFRTLAETTATAIVVDRGEILYANRAAGDLTGYPVGELVGMKGLDLIHPDFRALMEARREARLRGEPAPDRYEAVLLTRDGAERWVDMSAGVIRFDGKPAAIATIFDITDRKRAELALRQSDERLHMAQRAAGVITWDWNLLTDELVLSEGTAEFLAIPPDAVPGTTVEFFDRLVHPADRDRVLEAVQRAIRGEGDYVVEHRFPAVKRRERWFAERGRAIRDESGWVVRMVGVSIDITERKEAELALRDSEERLRLMIEQMPAILWTTDRNLRFTSSVGSGLGRLQQATNDVVGDTLFDYFGTQDERFVPVDAHRRALAGESVTYEMAWSGNMYQSHVEPLRDAEGRITGCIGIALDITAHRRAEDALFEEKERAQATLASIGDGVIRTDSNAAIDYLNPVAEKLTGFSAAEAVGQPLDTIYRVVDEASGKPLMNPVERCLRENRAVILPGQRLLVARNGGEFAVRDSAAPVRDRSGQVLGAVLAFKDITAVRDMEREMTYLASHDGLTGLLNRAEFERRLARALEAVTTDLRPCAMLYLDLAQLKVINDTCGHLAGDETLKQVARLLESQVREHDSVARLGGDEFGILLQDCPASEARRKAEQIREAFGRFRFAWLNRSFDVGVSIGLVPASAGDSVSRLVIAADTACRLARESGHNRIHEYQANDSALAERYGEMHWIHRIRRALDEESFQLHCQPVQPLHRGADPEELMGEVLLRMVDEDGELVMPETFVPTAERYRMISQIDRWVVKNSLRALAGWASLGGRHVTHMAINVSGESLNDDPFLDYVAEQLKETGVDPQRVLFEITETAAIANLGGAMRFISDLQERGCRFVLDDFGSGLSSFAYLKNLPVDCLKIAREFVRGVTEPGVQRTLVRSINQIGHDLGLKTIAEGVEDEPTLRVIEELKLDYAQGYWISPPQPLEIC